MSEFQDRLTLFLKDTSHKAAFGETVRAMFARPSDDMARLMAVIVNEHISWIYAAVADGNQTKVGWLLEDMFMTGAAQGYLFREAEYERTLREEVTP